MGTGLGEEGRLGPRRRIRSEFLVAVIWGPVTEMGGEMRGVGAMGWTKGSVRASGMGEGERDAQGVRMDNRERAQKKMGDTEMEDCGLYGTRMLTQTYLQRPILRRRPLRARKPK